MDTYTEGRGAYIGMHDFVTMIRGLQKKEDLDALIGVSGFKGFGKSTFSKQIMRVYVRKYFGMKFTPNMLEKYTAYTREDLERLVEDLPEFSPIDCDEAVNFAMGEDWMRSGNKRLKKIFAKIRNKHHLFFFNVPDLWWLDKKYREGMMNVWVHIIKKGHVIVSLPNIAPGIEDRWYKKWLEKNFTKNPVNFFTPLETVMRKMRRYPPYFDEFAFPKLPDVFYKKHLELRNKKVLEDGSEEKEENYRGLVQKQKALLISPIFKVKKESFKKIYTKIISDGGWTDKRLWETFYKDMMSYPSFKKYKEIAGETNDNRSQVLLPPSFKQMGNKRY